jgi:hypothetical protein
MSSFAGSTFYWIEEPFLEGFRYRLLEDAALLLSDLEL